MDEREQAVRELLDWLYDHGPALDEVPREWVVQAFEAAREEARSG